MPFPVLQIHGNTPPVPLSSNRSRGQKKTWTAIWTLALYLSTTQTINIKSRFKIKNGGSVGLKIHLSSIIPVALRGRVRNHLHINIVVANRLCTMPSRQWRWWLMISPQFAKYIPSALTRGREKPHWESLLVFFWWCSHFLFFFFLPFLCRALLY